MITWKVEKPNKNGIWLWRFINNQYLSDYLHNKIGTITIHGNIIEDSYGIVYESVDKWWNILPVETYYVGEYE